MNPTTVNAAPALLRRVGALVACALLLVVAGLALACGGHAEDGQKYYCPMHPTYVSDEPGDCPICNMTLVPVEDGAGAPSPAPSAAPGGQGQVLYYRHPHRPDVISDVPAKDEMGMEYVPVYADGGAHGAPASGGVPGLADVDLSAEGIRLAGVRTAVATTGSLARPIRTVGLVSADERRVRRVQTRISGWVEELHVDYTGQAVKAGQPILGIYSPELLASQEELLRAKEAAARFAGSSLPEVRRGGEDLVTAARRRLELFDVPKGFIAAVERSGKAQRVVTLTAPAAGFVTAKDVYAGQQVAPGMELFTLTDLSRVWVLADFYESEAGLLRIGQPLAVHLPFDAGRTITAPISFVAPTLAAQSRTLQVRLDLDNPDGTLRPGMYVDVVAQLGGDEGVLVPDDAVIDTGTRQVVFVEKASADGGGSPLFEPREVVVAVRGDGQALLRSGVAAGEKVATRANFLLDAESRLRAALSGLRSAPAPGAPAPSSPPAAHQH